MKQWAGETEDYQRQQLLLMFARETTGFWELVNHLEELESKALDIECTLDRNVVGTIVRCDPGASERVKTVTMKMDETGRTEFWTLSWEDKAGKRVYTFQPDVAVARKTGAVGDGRKQTGTMPATAEMRALLGRLEALG